MIANPPSLGMPNAAFQLAGADCVAPLADIGGAIVEMIRGMPVGS